MLKTKYSNPKIINTDVRFNRSDLMKEITVDLKAIGDNSEDLMPVEKDLEGR